MIPYLGGRRKTRKRLPEPRCEYFSGRERCVWSLGHGGNAHQFEDGVCVRVPEIGWRDPREMVPEVMALPRHYMVMEYE